MKHILKIDRPYVAPILSGEKSFEIRMNDRGFQKGDTVQFVVNKQLDLNETVEREEQFLEEQLENKEFEITYVLGSYGLLPGYVVFGIADRMW